MLQARDVDLVVLNQGIDTSTTVSRLFFSIIGAIVPTFGNVVSAQPS